MKNKKNKKKKVFKLVIVLVLIVCLIAYLLNIKVKNIYVTGNKLLSDQEIIELSGLENYPRLFSKVSKVLENKIKISPYIKSVNIKKNLVGKVKIEIEEYDLLLKDEKDNTVYLSNYKNIPLEDFVVGVPSLVNYVEKDILKDFLEELNKIDKNILSKISEITYSPNEYDKDLFLFYMNDGNYVYVTTSRLLNINKYDSILNELDDVKGILYLDSGNHFEIFS